MVSSKQGLGFHVLAGALSSAINYLVANVPRKRALFIAKERMCAHYFVPYCHLSISSPYSQQQKSIRVRGNHGEPIVNFIISSPNPPGGAINLGSRGELPHIAPRCRWMKLFPFLLLCLCSTPHRHLLLLLVGVTYRILDGHRRWQLLSSCFLELE